MSALRGRVALLTGASGGIGRALALALADEGAVLALGYGAHAEPAEELASQVVAAGGRARSIGADLRDAEAPRRLLDEVERALGPVELLICNAGLARRQTLEEASREDFDEVVAVNLRAPFLLAQRAAPPMRERGWGRILFVSSGAAFTGGGVGPHYAASKAGLLGLTHFLAVRLAPHGITVNAIAPSLIADTGMLPGDPRELGAQIPVGRVGRPEEVAELAIAMLRNGYLTNQVVALDGGRHPR